MYKLFAGKKAAYFTLGCKLNFAETSTVGQQLRQMGVQTAKRGEVADMCIINTCSVTEVADQKCRQAIHRLVKHHPGALVVVTGCYAQLKPEQVAAIDGVDLVLGAEQKGQILEYIAQRLAMMPEERALVAHEHHTVRTADIRTFMPSCSCGDRTRYFLKVRTDAIITVPIAPFPRPVAEAATAVLPLWWNRPARQQNREERKLSSPVSISAISAAPQASLFWI